MDRFGHTGSEGWGVAYAALLSRDGSVAAEVLDDASVLHLPGRSGLAGAYQGREAILGVLDRMVELTDGTLSFDVSGLLIGDAGVMVLRGCVDAGRDGVRLDADSVHVVSVRHGKIREAWIFSLDQSGFDEFWTGP